jgi:valyl-tRNA synthetase
MAESAITALEQHQPDFVPANWRKIYLQWLNNIEDWCISRQLWWGHRIPVWYDQHNQPYAGYDEADVRQRYTLAADIALHQDDDVIDTWFTAALWPFSSLHWPEQTPELAAFYPTAVLVTGFDIIFFWVARMVMMGLKLMDDIPFKTVYITGLIRDQHGQKMSKSKGNILDPIDLMDGIDLATLIAKRTTGLMQPQMAPAIKKATAEEFPQGIAAYGADALRFTFCALATTGRDINFDMHRIGGYRNFCNKLWNAARFVLMNTENQDFSAENTEYSLADRWIRSQLQTTIAQVNQAFAEYRFDVIAHLVYEFTWNEYCDWYLELAKCLLTAADTSAALQRGARRTLLEILETLLRLLHPLIPFITEEIWQTVAPMLGVKKQPSIMLAPYPESDLKQQELPATSAMQWLKQVVNGIRNVRGEMHAPPSKMIAVEFYKGSVQDRQYGKANELYIKSLAKVSQITWLSDEASPPPASATVVVDQLEIYIPLADLVDKNAELLRLQKEIDKLKRDQEKLSARLENPNYLQKAPPAVVEKEQQTYEQIINALTKLQNNYLKIEKL